MKNIKGCKYEKHLKVRMFELKDLMSVLNTNKPLFTSRHVLDDTSGRSSEDDGEGLQRGCFGKDDTVLDACCGECSQRLSV